MVMQRSSVKKKIKLIKSYNESVNYKDVTKPLYNEIKDYDDVSKMQYIDMYTWLRGDILLKADKMSTAHSLELRVPFLDKEVFDVASKIPTELKLPIELQRLFYVKPYVVSFQIMY